MNHIQPQVECKINYKFNSRLLAGFPWRTDAWTMAKVTSFLGLRIKARLSDLDQPQTWVAGKLEVTPQAVTKWIQGTSEPKYSHLIELAKLLKCSVGYLAGDQTDEAIAEVVRRMESVPKEFRTKALDGVIAVLATIPKSEAAKANKPKSSV